jgi:hypothetical protein
LPRGAERRFHQRLRQRRKLLDHQFQRVGEEDLAKRNPEPLPAGNPRQRRHNRPFVRKGGDLRQDIGE